MGKPELLDHLARVGRLHEDDLRRGLGRAPLPDAVARKYPNADRQWAWQYVFPASSHYTNGQTGVRHRHHLHETVIQKAVAYTGDPRGTAERQTIDPQHLDSYSETTAYRAQADRWADLGLLSCSADLGELRVTRRGSWPVRGLLLAAPALGQSGPLTVDEARRLVAAAVAQTGTVVTYDGSYRRIAYPGGDVPENIGVCTDVVIRAYRKLGVDLQVKVHEDMKRAFASYPQLWALAGPDPNIDHRRVPNLQTFFRRAGAQLPVSREGTSYRMGDLLTWMLPGNLPHIGLVTDRSSSSGFPLVVHNIGRGPQVEDVLFAHPITGHYRYGPP